MVFLWPALVAESTSELASAAARELVNFAVGGAEQPSAREPRWATRNRVAIELLSLRVRDFSTASEGLPTLVCAPFALHGATITDFAPGHSLVGALRGAGITRLFVTDWRSARADMRFLSIDNYLADLNVVVDALGGRVRLIGLCQGGWMALMYAACFPAKVCKLVLAGAPIDIDAGNSRLSKLARNTPTAIFLELVELGGGRILGRHALQFWSPQAPDRESIRDLLQSSGGLASARFQRLEARFRDWYAWTLDLPGTYYLQAVEHLFKENRLATGRFVALGRRIDLSKLGCPLFLLAARADDVVAPEQVFATERLVDGASAAVRKSVAPCGHLGLFMGKEILADVWPEIARWLGADQGHIGGEAGSEQAGDFAAVAGFSATPRSR
jgi:poly(3-hydroxyalkanoate) synthetase